LRTTATSIFRVGSASWGKKQSFHFILREGFLRGLFAGPNITTQRRKRHTISRGSNKGKCGRGARGTRFLEEEIKENLGEEFSFFPG
jgi:hypothetical protein